MKDGRTNPTVLNETDLNIRKNLILNSNVDLTKFGWVNKVEKITGLTRRQIYVTVNRTDLKNIVFRRH